MSRARRAGAWAMHLIDKLAIREFWMFTIAALSLGVVGAIGLVAVNEGLPKGAEAIVGGIVTGLILLARDVVNAIRALWRVSQEAEEQP